MTDYENGTEKEKRSGNRIVNSVESVVMKKNFRLRAATISITILLANTYIRRQNSALCMKTAFPYAKIVKN